jgi:hypothetical protein
MAEKQLWPLNRLIGLLKKRASPRNIKVARYDSNRVVIEKPIRDPQESSPYKPEKGSVIAEGRVVQDVPQSSTITGSDTLTPESEQHMPENLCPYLPMDIIRLASQNAAFRQGILALQRMNLDEDLFQDAIEDLRRKYYRERSMIFQPPDHRMQE